MSTGMKPAKKSQPDTSGLHHWRIKANQAPRLSDYIFVIRKRRVRKARRVLTEEAASKDKALIVILRKGYRRLRMF